MERLDRFRALADKAVPAQGMNVRRSKRLTALYACCFGSGVTLAFGFQPGSLFLLF